MLCNPFVPTSGPHTRGPQPLTMFFPRVSKQPSDRIKRQNKNQLWVIFEYFCIDDYCWILLWDQHLGNWKDFFFKTWQQTCKLPVTGHPLHGIWEKSPEVHNFKLRKRLGYLLIQNVIYPCYVKCMVTQNMYLLSHMWAALSWDSIQLQDSWRLSWFHLTSRTLLTCHHVTLWVALF